MARNLSDGERHERLTTRDRNRQIGSFVRKARSAFFADTDADRPMSTAQAWRAFADRTSDAAQAWLDRLRGIDAQSIEHLLAEVPPHRMSQVCRDFTKELLLENQRRLLAGENE